LLFQLISRKFNTLFPCHGGNNKAAMGRDFYPIKNSLFFFPLAHEYRKFVENTIYWSTVTSGG
jgi:hypothetical protein